MTLSLPPFEEPELDLDSDLTLPEPEPPAETVAAAPSPRVVVFILGEARYAVGVEQVAELETLGEVVELPRLPEWLLGITRLRGDILSVLDLGRYFGLAGRPGEERPALVVRAAGGDAVSAFVVDRIEGIRSLGRPLPAAPAPPLPGRLAEYWAGAFEVAGRPAHLTELGRLLTGLSLEEPPPTLSRQDGG